MNPVIAQESSVGIEKAKGEEQLQVEMAETTLTKERLSDNNYICPNESTYPMEQNSKSSSEETTKFKGTIVEIPKKDDGNEALKMIEQEEVEKTVEDTNQKKLMKVRLDQRDRFLRFHKKGMIHLPFLRN